MNTRTRAFLPTTEPASVKIPPRPARPLIEVLEPRIAPAYVLDTVVNALLLPDAVVPGDSGSVTFTVKNSGDSDFVPGGGFFGAPGGIHIDFSSTGAPGGMIMSGPEFEDSMPRIPAGKSVKITKSFTVPALDLTGPDLPEGNIFVRIDVRADNDYAFSAGRPFVFQFGDVGSRKDVKLATEEVVGFNKGKPVGDKVTFSLGGAGIGDLDIASGLIDVKFTGTDKSSAAMMSTSALPGGKGDGAVKLHNLNATQVMKKVALVNADVTGNVNFAEGLTLGLQLRDLGVPGGSDHTLSIASAQDAPKGVQLVFRKVQEMEISAPGGIASLKLNDWIDVNGDPDAVSTRFITSLVTSAKQGFTGAFQANLAITTGDDKGVGLGNFEIDGDLSNAEFTIGTMTPVSVGTIAANDVTNFKLKVTGDAKDVTFDSLNNASFGSNEVALEARTFEDIFIGGAVNAPIIKATGATANKMAIKSLTVDTVDRLSVDAIAGGIMKVAADDWQATTGVRSLFIGTLAVKEGDFKGDLTLSGPDLLPGPVGSAKLDAPAGIRGSITSAVIAGKITGFWSVKSSVINAVADEATMTFKLYGDENRGGLGLLKTSKDFAGEIIMHRLLAITVGGNLSGKITSGDDTFDSGPITVAGSILDAALDFAGSVKSIKAAEWKNGSFSTRGVDSLMLLGNPKESIVGNWQSVAVKLTGVEDSGLFSVAGSMLNVTFTNSIGAHIKAIKAGSWSGGGITDGSVGTLTLSRDLGDVKLFLTGETARSEKGSIEGISVGGEMVDVKMNLQYGAGTITTNAMTRVEITTQNFLNVLTLRGLSAGLPAYSASNITVGAMDTVTMRDVDPNMASSLSADKIASYTRYVGDTKVSGHPLKNLDAPATPDQAGQYLLTIR